MTRGERLRKLREDLGWTQEELGIRSGVKQPLISELENDKRPQISGQILAQLAKALHSTIDWIQRGDYYDGDSVPPGTVVIGVSTVPDGLTDQVG